MSNIAIYLRVSQEDKDKNKESNSISSQRALITNYIKKDEHLKKFNISEIIDDGYSGTNFDRPGIKKLFEDIKNNKMNCVIVKDLSRFGRNYIEVVNYLENIFPFMGVRFISINDNFDTSNSKYNLNSLDINFKNIINEYYSKDLGKKASTAKIELAKTGKYLSKPPLGYKKSTENKYKLEINDEEADIVKFIFQEYLKVKKLCDVARKLNSMNVKTKTDIKNKTINNKYIWTSRQVKRILKNEVYIGNTQYLKNIKLISCNKKIVENKLENIIQVNGTHEAIISKEDFYNVQKTFRKNAKPKQVESRNIFAYKLYCAYCKHTLQKCRQTYICRIKKYEKIEGCNKTNIKIEDLENVVFKSIKKIIFELLNKKIDNNNKNNIISLEKELKNLELKNDDNYISYLDNIITREEYLEEKKLISKKIDSLKIELTELKCKGNVHNEEKEFNKFKNKEKLTQEMVDLFIKKIYVYDNQNIEIEWNINIF